MVTVKRERRKNKRERESSVGNTTGTRFGNGTEHYGNARNEGNITGTCSVPPRKMLQLTLAIPGEQLVMPGCGEEDPAKLVRPQR